jgi:hypothetical protein
MKSTTLELLYTQVVERDSNLFRDCINHTSSVLQAWNTPTRIQTFAHQCACPEILVLVLLLESVSFLPTLDYLSLPSAAILVNSISRLHARPSTQHFNLSCYNSSFRSLDLSWVPQRETAISNHGSRNRSLHQAPVTTTEELHLVPWRQKVPRV